MCLAVTVVVVLCTEQRISVKPCLLHSQLCNPSRAHTHRHTAQTRSTMRHTTWELIAGQRLVTGEGNEQVRLAGQRLAKQSQLRGTRKCTCGSRREARRHTQVRGHSRGSGGA